MFQVYHLGRQQWKKIIVDSVPCCLEREIKRAYSRPLKTAKDARMISQKLRDNLPFLTLDSFDAYNKLEEHQRQVYQTKLWNMLDKPIRLSQLIKARMLDCNVISLAIAQVIPKTDVYFKSSYTLETGIERTTRHTFNVHQKKDCFFCVDLTKTHLGSDAFFCQYPALRPSYKKAEY